MTTRIGHLETSFAHMQSSLAHIQVQLAEQSVRFDRVEARLTRIEKRLELADAYGPQLVPTISGARVGQTWEDSVSRTDDSGY
jgi:uncharacterized coiled-coil protein SlyX